MRIKVFEESIPLEDMFKTIKISLKSEYNISNNSQIFNNSFLIIAKIPKQFIFIIRGSIERSKNRIILSLVALDTKLILNDSNLKKNVKNFENYLYDLILKDSNNQIIDPLKKISINGSIKQRQNKILMETERNVLNQILSAIYEKFNYKDDLKKYPFSTFNIERTREFWLKVYGAYLDKIEKRISKNNNNLIKVYKYYDFALSKDLFQRIFDLVIIENENGIDNFENIRDIINIQLEDNNLSIGDASPEVIKKHTKWIVFIHAHKKLKPMRLIDVLKLREDIRKYINFLNKRATKVNIEFKPLIVLISSKGYENVIGKYLRENLYHDFKLVFPMFIVPPINNEIWHNFKANSGLSQQEEDDKNRAEQFIKIHQDISKKDSYIMHNIQDVKEQYSEIIEKENKIKENLDFIDKWGKLLNIHKANELLNLVSNKY